MRKCPAAGPNAFALAKWEVVLMMAFLMALNALAIDIMLPGLQQIGASLGVEDANNRQFIITAYVFGMGCGQLFFGPFSDRFGRKTSLLIGVSIYLGSSLVAAFSSSLAIMLAVRFIQGIGSASARVLTLSIVRDLYGGTKMAEVMSLVMMVYMIIPIIAPTIGQSILYVGEWHLIFLFLAVFSAAMFLWVLIRLPETLDAKDVRPFRLGAVVKGFGLVLSNRTATLYVLAATLIQGCMFAYITSAQQVYTEVFAIGSLFPIAFAGIGVVVSASALLNSRMIGRFGVRRLSQTALIGFVATTAVWLAIDLAYGGRMPFWLFYFIMAVGWFQYGWIGANISTLAMEPLGRIAGTGSSVLGFSSTAGAALLGSMVGLAFNGTTTPLAVGFFCLGLFSLLVVVVAERGKFFWSDNAGTGGS